MAGSIATMSVTALSLLITTSSAFTCNMVCNTMMQKRAVHHPGSSIKSDSPSSVKSRCPIRGNGFGLPRKLTRLRMVAINRPLFDEIGFFTDTRDPDPVSSIKRNPNLQKTLEPDPDPIITEPEPIANSRRDSQAIITLELEPEPMVKVERTVEYDPDPISKMGSFGKAQRNPDFSTKLNLVRETITKAESFPPSNNTAHSNIETIKTITTSKGKSNVEAAAMGDHDPEHKVKSNREQTVAIKQRIMNEPIRTPKLVAKTNVGTAIKVKCSTEKISTVRTDPEPSAIADPKPAQIPFDGLKPELVMKADPRPTLTAAVDIKPKARITAGPKSTPIATAEPKLKAGITTEPRSAPTATIKPKLKAKITTEPKPIPAATTDIKPKATITVDPKPAPVASAEPKASIAVEPKTAPAASVESKLNATNTAEPKPTLTTTAEPKPEHKPNATTIAGPKPTPIATVDPKLKPVIAADPIPETIITSDPEPETMITSDVESEPTFWVQPEPQPKSFFNEFSHGHGSSSRSKPIHGPDYGHYSQPGFICRQLIDNRDYYTILDVSIDSNAKEIKSAYRKLVKEHHPDANLGEDTADKLKEINCAYEVLKDPSLKRTYDLLHFPREASRHNYGWNF